MWTMLNKDKGVLKGAAQRGNSQTLFETAMDFILVIDQGTHSSRALLFDMGGQLHSSHQQKIALTVRDAQHIEQDPEEILQSVKHVLNQALSYAEHQGEIKCMALATQRSTVVAWQRDNGKPLAPALSWLDTRTQKTLNTFTIDKLALQQKTGLRLSPHYGASKLAWYTQHKAEIASALEKQNLCYGPLVSFLLFHLVNSNPCLQLDHGNACRTLLFNIATQQWDKTLMDAFNIEAQCLPHITPIRYHYGTLKSSDTPVTAVHGDQAAVVFADGNPQQDTAYINLGSGAFVLVPTGEQRIEIPGLLNSICDSDHQSQHYYVEGTVNGCGTAVTWAAKQWQLPELETALVDLIGDSACDTQQQQNWIFINTVAGLGSPWWQTELPPALLTLEGKTVELANIRLYPTAAANALVESIVFLLQINLDKMREAGFGLKQLIISGGLSKLDAICQRLANLSGLVTIRPAEIEATAKGMAWLAAGKPQQWQTTTGTSFKPQQDTGLMRRYTIFQLELKRRIQQHSQSSDRLNIIAHRGDVARYPENTLQAIAGAISAGANFVEFDLQMSADHIPVLHHDGDLARTAQQAGVVMEMTAQQLQNISVHEAHRFGDKFQGTSIATLSQLVQLLNSSPEVGAFIEFKEDSVLHFGVERFAALVFETMRAACFPWVAISHNHKLLSHIRKVHQHPVGWVVKFYNNNSKKIAKILNPDYLFCNVKRLPINLGPSVNLTETLWEGEWHWAVYVVDNDKTQKALSAAGIHWIETNQLKI